MATPALTTVRTMCPMSCHPTLCGMLVDVRGSELGGVRGDEENPDSQGFRCGRGKASREVIGNPQRLLHPLVRERREEGAWRRASWDEALDRIAAAMRAVGREAVGIWPGHGVFTTAHPWTVYPFGDDVKVLADTGTTVGHCPYKYAKMAMTLHSFQRYLDAGVRMALGTDTYPMDMVSELRMAAVLARTTDGMSVVPMHTRMQRPHPTHPRRPSRAKYWALTLW